MSPEEVTRRWPRSPSGRIRLGDAPAPDEPRPAGGAALQHDGRGVPVPPEGIGVGRDPSCGLQLRAADAPARAIELEPVGDGHRLVISDPRPAILLNGRLLAPDASPLLRGGDRIAIGSEQLRYRAVDADRHLLLPAPAASRRRSAAAPHVVLGRDSASDLPLQHPTVSRRHAVIAVRPDGATIEAAHGGTGVRVNGRPTRRRRLAIGDEIAIGPYRIQYDGDELIERAAGPGLSVHATGVSYDAGGRTILHPLDLHLRPGELVAIIGGSGAGKTTLLNVLAGVQPPARGRVLVDGEDVGGRLSDLGYVPQFDIVHAQLTVTEALDYGARLRLPADTAASERAARVHEVIGQLDLGRRARAPVGELSGGERKRVAVGMELLHLPGALFLDEPTTGLDPLRERRMMQLFRELADSGKTVALVTHATASIRLAHRVVAMGRDGHLRFAGTPDEALAAFGARRFVDVYATLDGDGRGGVVPRRPRRLLGAPRPSGRMTRPLRQPLAFQTLVLSRRYATLLARDQRWLISMILQPPAFGLLLALLFHAGVFNRAVPDYGQSIYTGKSTQLLFLMGTIAIWLGSIAAAREIVKERHVLARELAVGVDVRAYLASKLVVLLTVVGLQTLVFTVTVLALRPLHESGGAGLLLTATLVLASWVAVMWGLTLSAFARSEDHATSIIPLLLVPQLLFGGALVTLRDMTLIPQIVASIVPVRWTFAAAGAAIDLNGRIADDRRFAAASSYGQDFFALPLPVFLMICGANIALLFWAIAVRLRRGGRVRT